VVTASPQEKTTYVLTATSPGGCIVRREVTVDVVEAPTVYVASEKQQICEGESVRIRAAGLGPFAWYANNVQTELASDIINVSASSTTIYEVRAGTIGCQSKASVTVEVKPKAVMSPEQETYVVCPGGATNLRINGAETVTWLNAPGLIQTDALSARVGPSENQEYRAVATDANGCSDTLSIFTKIAETDNITIRNSSPTLCPGMFSELSAEEGVSFRWSPQIGLSSTEGARVIARPPSTTTYFLTATDEYGCVSRARTTVMVGSSAFPKADFTLQRKRICAGETVRFVDKSTGATSFAWEFPGSQTPFSNEQNPKVTYDRPGVYDVVLRVEGCVGSDFKEMRGYISVGRPSEVSLNTAFVNLCKGDSILLVASGALEYQWEPALGLSTSNESSVWAFPKKDQQYTVSGIDQYGCEGSAEVQIQVQGSGAKAGISSATTDICEGEAAKLTASGADRYGWFNEAGELLGQGATLNFKPNRDMLVRLEARQTGGCVSRDQASIRVKPAPAVSLEATKTKICAGESVLLTASGALEYRWEPTPGLIPNGNQASIAPLSDRTIKLKAEDGLGCSAMASIEIDVQSGKDLLLRSFDTTLCPGEETIITALGGREYSWSPTTGLDTARGAVVVAAPGKTTKYVVTSESEEGCPAVATINVQVYEANSFRIFPPQAERCAGDTITLRASGASNVQWAAGPGLRPSQQEAVTLKPRETATYRASGIDANGCEVEGVATVNLRTMDDIDVQASASSVCFGESVELEAKGGTTYTWLEAPGLERPRGSRITAIPQEKTTYSVVVSSDMGCKDTASIAIDVKQMDADFDVSTKSIDLATDEGLVSFQDKTVGAVEWVWDFGDGGESTEAFSKHFYDKPGVYSVAMAVTDGVCVDEDTATITVINSSSLAELEDADGLEVKPSKTEKDHVDLLINSDRPMRLRYRVLDAFGTALLNDHIRFGGDPYRKTLDLGEFGSGKYLIQLSDGEETWEKRIEL
jgi:PKD repeat protein